MTSDAGRLPRIQGAGTRDYLQKAQPRGDSLADVLERVLDKGIVIAGDIQIRLLDIELLTIKIRLLVASVERAREMGINWWESDEYLTPLDDAADKGELNELTQRLEALEGRMTESPQGESNRASREENQEVGPEMDETIVHAYGVVTADEPLSQLPPGVADTSAWVFGADSLAAIVSLLPMQGFGVADWERNATNVGWLGRVARQHHEVLQYVSNTTAVVPLRLPSLYRNLESLHETLHAASDRLERDLHRIRGKLEWSVKVYRTAEEQSSAVNTSASGRDYLQARSHDLSTRSTARERLREQVGEIHDALGQVSAEYVRNKPQDAVLSGRKEQMLLNGAYLVSRADQARFLELVGEMADDSLAGGLLVELSGPWPAYNFTGDAEAATREAIK